MITPKYVLKTPENPLDFGGPATEELLPLGQGQADEVRDQELNQLALGPPDFEGRVRELFTDFGIDAREHAVTRATLFAVHKLAWSLAGCGVVVIKVVV